MTSARHRATALAAFAAASLLAASLGGQTTRPDDLAARTKTLSRQVLADPLDSAGADRLAEMHRQQEQLRLDALAALSQGLQSYLEGQASNAANRLAVARDVPYVASLANANLTRSLDDIIAACDRKIDSALCGTCGDTRRADCTASGCYASGRVPCFECRGTGRVQRAARVDRCPICSGRGSVDCKSCGGNGTLLCPDCAGGRAGGVGPAESRGIRKVIAMSDYLRSGGADLVSRDALAPSPRLGSP